MKFKSETVSVITYFFHLCIFFFLDDDDRDIQADRAVDYGKRHQAIDILWMGTFTFLDFLKLNQLFFFSLTKLFQLEYL